MDFKELENKKVLVGVSGGSDSMALLHLLDQAAQKKHLTLAVAHINHHLRPSADEEESFVKNYCEKRQIPCFVGHWQPTTTRIEEEARKFRYAFFKEVLEKEQYDVLCTAHHQDDRIETAMKRMIAGYHLWDLDGLKQWRSFDQFSIYRPLIHWTKEDILAFCKHEKIPFCEDESNWDLQYERNRLRHQLIPLMKKENQRFGEGMTRLLEQIDIENQWVQQMAQQILTSSHVKTKEDEYFVIEKWQEPVCWLFCRYLMSEYQIAMTHQKAEMIVRLCQQTTGTQYLRVSDRYQLERSYGKVRLLLNETVEKGGQEVYTLNVNRGLFLSKNEWIGQYDYPLDLPAVKGWKSLCWQVPKETLMVRHPQPNDVFVLDKEGHHKKVRRLMIDQKIPSSKRSQLWVLVNHKENIRGVLPLRQSYLSNYSETDKMNYIIYYYKIE